MGPGPVRQVDVRVGLGYDLHRLAAVGEGQQSGRPLVIGGVDFGGGLGPVAHSDGDALMHAVTDAILGALALPDIGELFPDKDPKWAGAKSAIFLAEAVRLAGERGWRVGNVDATVILERPKLAPRKAEVRSNLARILGVSVEDVNVKGKTHELRDPNAVDRVIEAHAVVLMLRVE